MVDDEPEICALTKSFLAKKNYAIMAAQDEPSALQALKSGHFDLVLLDLRLGNSSGIELLRKIKEFDQDTKVVMVTALDDEESIRQAKSLGADDYITKPFTSERLGNLVAEKLTGSGKG